MRYLILLFCFVSWFSFSQDFEGVLMYKREVVPHLSDEIKIQFKDPSGKKGDSIKLIINNSNFVEKSKNSRNWVDSLRIVFGKNKIKKTYYKKKNLEYVFDFDKGKKYTHTPDYQCIDSVEIKFKELDSDLKFVQSDSIYNVNGVDCKKITISKKDFLFIDLFVTESDYKNTADGFIYDIMNNLLFDNLYPFRKELENHWVVKLRYYTKYDQVDIIYTLQKRQTLSDSHKEFVFPQYEYCYWDILNDKKLMRKHRKRMKKKKKG
ncbi:hypothetical protein AAON49_10845 [Pseudotenacibaculum sp. MALMAid0570]|uniref:hypothetical protein n=1 Tax=Pseudotenacibaculum sp. MALMAid0570 TaxID=3143938 RepID=UPI0032DECBA6